MIKKIHINNYFNIKDLLLEFPLEPETPKIISVVRGELDFFFSHPAFVALHDVVEFIFSETKLPNGFCDKDNIFECTFEIKVGEVDYIYYFSINSEQTWLMESLTKNQKTCAIRETGNPFPVIGSGEVWTEYGEESFLNLHFDCSNKYFPILLKSTETGKIVDSELRKIKIYNEGKDKESYSNEAKAFTRKFIPQLGFQIDEITENWKILTEFDPTGEIPLESHGSGLRKLVTLVSAIYDTSKEEGLLCIPDLSFSLHFKVEETLLKFFNESFNREKNSCLLIETGRGDSHRRSKIIHKEVFL